MSRIDDLIAELCPDGVPHLALGEIGKYSDTRVPAPGLNGESYTGVDNLLPINGGRRDPDFVLSEGNLTG